MEINLLVMNDIFFGFSVVTGDLVLFKFKVSIPASDSFQGWSVFAVTGIINSD